MIFFKNKLITKIVFLLLGLSSLLVHSKPTIQDYAALPSVSNMRLAPDGTRVAFLKVIEDEDYIMIYSLTQKKILTGTKLGDLVLQNLYFISDKEIILTASKNRRVLGIMGKFELSTAFVFDLESGDIRQLLTPGDVVYKGQSGLGDIVGISQDKQFAFMPAYVGVSDGYARSNYALVKKSLVKKNSHPIVVEEGSPTTLNYFVNTKGEVVAEELFDNKKNLHSIFSRVSGKRLEIYSRKGEFRRIALVGLTPDEKSLVIRTGNPKTDRKVLYTMSLIDGEISSPIFSRSDADIDSVIYDGLSQIIKGVKYSGFMASYEFFDKKLEDRVSQLVNEFPGDSVILVDWNIDFSKILLKVSGNSSSGTYYLSNKGEQLKFLANTRPRIKAEEINPIMVLSYFAEDKLKIPALLTVPYEKTDNMKLMPTVMLPHGGPESYDRVSFDWLAQSLANQGYLVIQPQFRGSSGFGLSHIQAGHGEWGKKMQSDLSDGVMALVKKGIVDPKRICIVGWSYGGYAAQAGAAFTPNLYQCAVSINGVSDLPLMIKREKKEYGKDHWVFSYWKNQITGDISGDEEILESYSPINFAENIVAPLLLIHGEKDKIVNVEQSENMYEKLEDLNKTVLFKSFPGEEHSVSGSHARNEVLHSVVEFVNKYIGHSKTKK